jgi:hypothetical protein
MTPGSIVLPALSAECASMRLRECLGGLETQHPLIQARLFASLARHYEKLGELDLARTCADNALDYMQALLAREGNA